MHASPPVNASEAEAPDGTKQSTLPESVQEQPVTDTTGRGYLRLVLVLGALVALGPLTIDTYLPALPTLADEFGASESAAQFTLTGIMLGLGLGQLVLGPLSDAIGRRPVMLGGMIVHAAMSVFAAISPSVGVLTAVRIGQGVAGAAVAVTAMAVVRDLFSGRRAAGLLSHLTLVLGAAPILAPTIGGLVLQATGWRGIFVLLAIAAVLLGLVALFFLPETLPPQRRQPATFAATTRTYASLFHDRAFIGLVLTAGLLFGCLFSYVAGSTFVFQEFYGLSEQQFALVFGLNAAGLIGATQLNPLLLKRFSPQQVLSGAVAVAMVSTVALVVAALSGASLPVLMVPLWLSVTSVAFSFPNTPALALSRHGENAGAAAAMLGAVQFGLACVVTPLVGALATGNAVGMTVVMAGSIWFGALALFAMVRPWTLPDLDDDADGVAVAH